MILKKLVETEGGIPALVKMMESAGFECQYAKIHQILSGSRPCSVLFAIQVEAATKGRVQAMAVLEDSLKFWRNKKNIRRYAIKR